MYIGNSKLYKPSGGRQGEAGLCKYMEIIMTTEFRKRIQSLCFQTKGLPETDIIKFSNIYGEQAAESILQKVLADTKHGKAGLWRQLARTFKRRDGKRVKQEKARADMIAGREAADPNFDPTNPAHLKKALDKYYADRNCNVADYALGLKGIELASQLAASLPAKVEEEAPF